MSVCSSVLCILVVGYKNVCLYVRLYVCIVYTYLCQVTKNAGVTSTEPCPRYAHMLVYDNVKKIHYMFGGKKW